MQWLQIIAADGIAPLVTDPSSILPAISTLGSFGFAVWYAYYTTTVAIPKLLEAHRAERLEMQARFDITVHELLVEMKAQRDQFVEWRTSVQKS